MQEEETMCAKDSKKKGARCIGFVEKMPTWRAKRLEGR